MTFDPSYSPAKGPSATCPKYSQTFPVARTVRVADRPPDHRLYAKLVLLPDGTKAYLAATDGDCDLYKRAQLELASR